jgi:hypothetical protein
MSSIEFSYTTGTVVNCVLPVILVTDFMIRL